MKRVVGVVVLLACSAVAKDSIQVEVRAVHAVTHEDQGIGAIVRKGG